MSDILVIDDDPDQRRLLGRWLEREGWSVGAVATGTDGLAALTSSLPVAVVLDVHLVDEDGLDVLERIVERHPEMPVVMLTSDAKVEVVVEAMRKGATDYLTKPMGRTQVITTLRNAVERGRMAIEIKQLKREASGGGFGAMVGDSPAMRRLFRQLDRVAPSEVTVLIQGESGTGKELVARALHEGSSRAGGPFVALNCAAIPETLQESELFGHEMGAFTGASARRAGRFEQADGGTLFLDEVGELTAPLQAKLLRALQERRFYRVGGQEEIAVDVRIVAATHRDLEEAVHTGAFRDDLFYRLAVYELALPPLRARGDDILALAHHLLARHPGGGALTLSDAVRHALSAYPWPGNVRELDNAMARAAVSAERVVQLSDLPPRIRGASPATVLKPMEDLERVAIEQAITRCGGNISEVIRTLGIPRTSLYRKLKKYGIQT